MNCIRPHGGPESSPGHPGESLCNSMVRAVDTLNWDPHRQRVSSRATPRSSGIVNRPFVRLALVQSWY
jgi:hypothetical protein